MDSDILRQLAVLRNQVEALAEQIDDGHMTYGPSSSHVTPAHIRPRRYTEARAQLGSPYQKSHNVGSRALWPMTCTPPPSTIYQREINVIDVGHHAGPHVAKFSGHGRVPFAKWVVALEDLFDLAKDPLTDPQKVAHVRINLTGNARSYFDALTDAVKKDYKQVIAALKVKFPAAAAKSLANFELANISQNTGEGVGEYAERVRDLVDAATVGEHEAVRAHRLFHDFVKGLNPSVRIMVKKEDPPDFDKAAELAQRLEGLLDEEAMLRSPREGGCFTKSQRHYEVSALEFGLPGVYGIGVIEPFSGTSKNRSALGDATTRLVRRIE